MNPSQQSSYPNLNPYPAQVPPPIGSTPPSSQPATGPGSGFPPRSGLAGLQPNAGPGYRPSPSQGGGGGGGGVNEEKNFAQLVKENTNVYARKFQGLLDRSTPHIVERWGVTAILFLLFAVNVILRQGWYIVCYALAIYILNLFLAFLQPRFDPSLAADLAADDVEEGAPGLPGGGAKPPTGFRGLMSGFSGNGGGNGGDAQEEEFRPFIRRLPEFKFWYSATKATAIALFCTVTRATDVPVYWPILLIYFFTLFGLTMRRQIQHMIKYKYIPFDLGKKTRYGKK